MPEAKEAPKPYIGKVYCSFCGGYDRKDGGTRDVMPFMFYGGVIPAGHVLVICPNCFLEGFEKILGRQARFIDADAAAIDWSGAFKL